MSHQPTTIILRSGLGGASFLIEEVSEITEGTGVSCHCTRDASESSMMSRRGDTTLVASDTSLRLRQQLLAGAASAVHNVGFA